MSILRGGLVGAVLVAGVAFLGTGWLFDFGTPFHVSWVFLAGVAAVPGAVVGLVGGVCIAYFVNGSAKTSDQIPLK